MQEIPHNGIHEVDLMSIPFINTFTILDDNFIIADQNNDSEQGPRPEMDRESARIISLHEPVKVGFAFGMACRKGYISLRINLQDVTLHENDVLPCRPGSIIQVMNLSDDLRITFIGFSDSYYIDGLSSRQNILFNSFLSKHLTIRLEGGALTHFNVITKMMTDFIGDEGYQNKREAIRGCMMLLIYEAANIITGQLQKMSRPESRSDEVCQDFLRLLDKYHTSNRKVSFYAEQLCLSPKHLSRVVLSVTGKHITEWIDEYVLLEARSLLHSRKYSIQQVSDLLNFPNQSFFGTWFKRHAGISPKAYMDTR